jgi:cytoskeleton protein RodZ
MTTQKEKHSELSSKLGSQHGGPGLRLQEARVQAGLSVDEIASHLRLRVSVIEELEDNQFNNMAGLVFVRGYLRAYARALNIDADEVVSMFNELNFKEEVPVVNALQSRMPAERGERPIRWMMVVILFSVSVLSLLWWNASRHNKKSTQLPAQLVQQEELGELPLDELSDMKVLSTKKVKQKSPVKVTLNKKSARR